jgi:preprotein translocase subunit YajC
MHIESSLNYLLAAAPPPSDGAQQDPLRGILSMMGFLVPMLLIMYVVMIRPQRKREREHAELLKSVKRGDKITTSGGLIGIVISVSDKTVTLRSVDSKLEISKSAIAEITERGSGDTKES